MMAPFLPFLVRIQINRMTLTSNLILKVQRADRIYRIGLAMSSLIYLFRVTSRML